MGKGISGLLGLLGRRAARPTALLLDTFTDTDGTALDAHTMDVGGGWTLSGTWTIASNKATKATSFGRQVAHADAGQADVDVSAAVTWGAGVADAGLCLRLTGAIDHFEVRVSATLLRLIQVEGGVETVRASAAVSVSGGSTHTVRAVCSGQSITCYLDGAQVCDYGSASFNQSATRCGLAGYSDGAAQIQSWDDFEVRSP